MFRLYFQSRVLVLCALVGFFLGLPTARSQAPSTDGTAILNGVVTDDKGNPLAGAEVVLPAVQKGGYTNEQGIYAISRLPGGKFEVIIVYPGFDTLLFTAELPPNKKTKLDFVLKESITLETIEIIDNAQGKIDALRVNTGLTQISARDINMIPTLGTPDLSAYLQVVPGVVFTGDQGGQLYIRGGTPVQNLTLLDGAIIYNPFHTLGIFSIFDTDIIRTADVYSGGFSAEYGGRISSVIDIKTRPGNFSRFSARAHANPVTAGALVEGPIGQKGKNGLAPASYLLSARHCYLNQTSPTLYGYANDTVGLPFSFTDLFGKFTLGNASNFLSLSGFYQRDAVDYGFPTSYQWNQAGGTLNFQLLPSNTNMIISGNFSSSNYFAEQVSVSERSPRRSSVGGFNGRLNFQYILNSVNELAYGIQIMGFNTDIFQSNQLGLTAQESKFNTELAGYFKYKKVFQSKKQGVGGVLDVVNRFVLEPSVRLHYYADQTQVTLEPRLKLKLNFKGISFQFNAGMYTQNLMTATSDRDVVNLFQGYFSAPEKLGNALRDDGLQAAYQLMGGTQIELVSNLDFLVEGWYKNFTQLTNVNRNRLFATNPTFIAESGVSYGVDFILKYRINSLYLYATYGLGFNERMDESYVFKTYNPVYDRRHTVNFVGDYKLGELKEKTSGRRLDSAWEFSVRWTFGSGFPFNQTQALFEKVDFGQNGAQTDYVGQNGAVPPNPSVLLAAEYNSGRLPSYHRLDVSIKRRFRIGERAVVELNLNAINTYSRANIFYYDRLRNTRVDQLPIMPTAGVVFTY
jgi:hypothetical protein